MHLPVPFPSFPSDIGLTLENAILAIIFWLWFGSHELIWYKIFMFQRPNNELPQFT